MEGDSGGPFGFRDGDPVYGYPGLTGCYAQYVACPGEQMAPIPACLPRIDAGAVPVDGLTAEQGLTAWLGVKAGDVVLITAGGLRPGPPRGADGPRAGRDRVRHGEPAAP